jgi:SAM-dependent methyltransferase
MSTGKMTPEQFDVHINTEDAHWWFVGRRSVVRSVLSAVIPAGEGRKVVEVGMGTGGNIAALSEDYHAVGVDVDEYAVDLARSRDTEAELLQGNILTDHAGSLVGADAVLLLDVLEHIEDADAFFRDLFDLAPNGAVFLITVPADPKLWSPHDEHHGHYRRYTEATLRAHWEGLDVDEILVSYFNARLYPVVRAVRVITNLLGHTSGEAGTDLSMPPVPANRLLAGVLGGERHRLLRSIEKQTKPYRRGVSLVALIRKKAN